MAPAASSTSTVEQQTQSPVLKLRSDMPAMPEGTALADLCRGPNPLRGEFGPVNGMRIPSMESTTRLTTSPGIPTFASHQEHRQHIALHMAAAFRNWARVGFTEGTSGHISVRDPEYDNLIWMNPIGKHFALLNAGDMLCLDINTGKIVGGNRVGTRIGNHVVLLNS